MNPETQKLLEDSTKVAQQAAQVSGQTFTPGYTPQKIEPVSPVINAADLGNVPKIQTVPKPAPADPTPFVSSLNLDSINEYIQSQMQPQQTQPLEDERSGLIQRLSSTLERFTGRSRRDQLVQEETRLGVPQKVKELEELQLQIAQKKSAYEKTIETLGNQPILGSIAQGQQGNVQRLAALELGALASIAQVKMGQVSLAQQTAREAVDLAFQDEENEIKMLQTQLDLNREELDRKNSKEAQNLEIALNERSRLLAEQKQERMGVIELAQEAAQNGADNVTINRILQTSNTEEAMSLASPFIGALDRQQQSFQQNLALRDQALQEAQERRLTLEAENNTVIGNATQNAAAGYADRVLQSNLIIDQIGNNFTGLKSYGGGLIPNYFKSADRQKFEQAQRNFINAVLRRESGAVISPEEFANARQQYFPQPGDKPEVLFQKAQNRRTAANNLIREAGPVGAQIADPLSIL